VLREADSLALTNEPDPDRLASDLNLDSPAGRFLLRSHAGVARGISCLPAVFRGIGLAVVGFGAVLMVYALIATVFFDVPMKLNGRVAGKVEAVVFQAAFLAGLVAFGALWHFVVGKVFPAADRYWRLDLRDDEWVLRQGYSRSVLGRVSPHEIAGLTVDRQGSVVAETVAGKRRRITGPMAPIESAWAARALSGLLGQSSGARRVADSTIYACVPTVDPAESPGSTLRHRLTRADHPWKATVGCLAIAAFWNILTTVFVIAQISGFANWKGPFGMSVWVVLVPFVLVGVCMLAGFVLNLITAIDDTRAGTTVVEVSMHPLRPGEPCKVFVSSQGRFMLTAMVVRLVCEEGVKTESSPVLSPRTLRESPATQSKRVRAIEVYHGDGLPSVAGLTFEATFQFQVPADVMHSLDAEHNKVSWLIEVEGSPAGRPAYRREFAIVVNPPRSSGAAS